MIRSKSLFFIYILLLQFSKLLFYRISTPSFSISSSFSINLRRNPLAVSKFKANRANKGKKKDEKEVFSYKKSTLVKLKKKKARALSQTHLHISPKLISTHHNNYLHKKFPKYVEDYMDENSFHSNSHSQTKSLSSQPPPPLSKFSSSSLSLSSTSLPIFDSPEEEKEDDMRYIIRPIHSTQQKFLLYLGSYMRFDELPRVPLAEIAIIGRSNVGKSSLLKVLHQSNPLGSNSLSPFNVKLKQKIDDFLSRYNFKVKSDSYKLPLVSKIPGRTRGLNYFLMFTSSPSSYSGPHTLFVDLPGYGYANLPLEVQEELSREIQDYLLYRESLRGVIMIIDSRRKDDIMRSDQEMIEVSSIIILCFYTKSSKILIFSFLRKIIFLISLFFLNVIYYLLFHSASRKWRLSRSLVTALLKYMFLLKRILG